jgi:hypothetical protein
MIRRSSATLEQLFDRTWRPGHPFRPRLSPLRRWGTFCVLCFLLSVIAAYWYLTDSTRVRKMCETYLSQLTGGNVSVKRAALSIFEGLRLDGVSIRVDKAGAEFDSTLFEVQTVLLKYNPESILNGKLDATQIVAIEPRVRLCENLDARKWNYQRISLPTQPSTKPQDRRITNLPQILLRNGQVYYSQIQDGKLLPQGTMSLDGSLSPGETSGTCVFRLQSRVESETLGPVVQGQIVLATGETFARLENFEFGPAIKRMLPRDVRQTLEDHQLAGRVDVPSLHVIPGGRGPGKPTFRVEMNLNKVNLAVSPNEWLSRVERQQIDALHGAFDLMRVAGLGSRGSGVEGRGSTEESADPRLPTPDSRPAAFVDRLDAAITPNPIRLEKVDGQFVFTQDGISVRNLTGWVERNSFQIAGNIGGYNADAPATVDVVGDDIYIPHSPRYVNAMPRVVREVYEALHPEGSGHLWVRFDRTDPGKKPVVSGELNIVEGQFVFNEFPYPLRNVTGKVAFGPDPVHGEKLEIQGVRGWGVVGGPNENNFVTINGSFAPINPDGEVHIRITGEHLYGEPTFRAALPREARDALKILDPSGRGDYPTFKTNVAADVTRELGPRKPVLVTVSLDLEDAAGAFEAFPYPLDHVTGHVVVAPNCVTIDHCTSKKGDASVMIDGKVTFGKDRPVVPDVTLIARNVPIDKTLLAAISPDRRSWLEFLGVTGKLDVDGKIAGSVMPTTSTTQPTTRPSDVTVALDMFVHDGTLWPHDTTFAISDLSGKLRLADNRVTLGDFKGKRGEASLFASGSVDWVGGAPQLAVTASAKNLHLEPALYQLLPKDAQTAWDTVQPEGTVDVSLRYGNGAATTQPTTAPTTRPVYQVTLNPNKLAATVKSLPYKLTELTGTIEVTPNGATLQNVIGKHGAATIAVNGTGSADTWNLQLSARRLPVDDDLRSALPPALCKLLNSMKLRGNLSFDFQKLNYRPGKGKAEGDVDLVGGVWFSEASMDLGVPVTDASGVIKLDTALRAGKLAGLKGSVQAPALIVAQRPAKDFYCELFKPENQDVMRLDKIQGSLAGGEIAGQVDVAFPDNASSRFALGLVLRNSDITALTGEKDIHGQLTASLALEGSWDDPATRRGRGDVAVSGRDMYQIPLMLGLLQITNLSLPISSPFSEGNARYNVDGQKITFEQIELRASNMIMQGSGSLNFDTKKVRMTFVTDNPNWPKLPLVNELIQGAKHELLQIHVNGTVTEPKVSGSVLTTFQTTVDEVLRGGDPSVDSGRRKGK